MIKISVIVTAYKREIYLHEALNTLLSQTLGKEHFEVILLTDFKHDASAYHPLNIRHFILNGSVGEYMYKALNEARGDIICFLDDDDLYDNRKLSILIQHFSEATIYFKHSVQPFHTVVDIKKEPSLDKAKLRYIQYKDYKHPNLYAYNRTSIALRRSFIVNYAETLRKIDVAEDWFFFLAFLTSNGDGIYYSGKLSFYRRHESVSHKSIDKDDRGYEDYVSYLLRLIDSFNFFRELFNDPSVQKILKYQLSVFRIRLLLLTEGKKSTIKKTDLINLLEASIFNYNEYWIIKSLFFRAFMLYYYPTLSKAVEYLYKRVSRLINAL